MHACTPVMFAHLEAILCICEALPCGGIYTAMTQVVGPAPHTTSFLNATHSLIPIHLWTAVHWFVGHVYADADSTGFDGDIQSNVKALQDKPVFDGCNGDDIARYLMHQDDPLTK